jgi:hypothetical protein
LGLQTQGIADAPSEFRGIPIRTSTQILFIERVSGLNRSAIEPCSGESTSHR